MSASWTPSARWSTWRIACRRCPCPITTSSSMPPIWANWSRVAISAVSLRHAPRRIYSPLQKRPRRNRGCMGEFWWLQWGYSAGKDPGISRIRWWTWLQWVWRHFFKRAATRDTCRMCFPLSCPTTGSILSFSALLSTSWLLLSRHVAISSFPLLMATVWRQGSSFLYSSTW